MNSYQSLTYKPLPKLSKELTDKFDCSYEWVPIMAYDDATEIYYEDHDWMVRLSDKDRGSWWKFWIRR